MPELWRNTTLLRGTPWAGLALGIQGRGPRGRDSKLRPGGWEAATYLGEARGLEHSRQRGWQADGNRRPRREPTG